MSQAEIKAILSAGVAVVCPGDGNIAGAGLNGWFLKPKGAVGDFETSVYTNAHALYDDDGRGRRATACYVYSMADLTHTAYVHSKFQVGTTDPARKGQQVADRARLTLVSPVSGARSLSYDPSASPKSLIGTRIYEVSLLPPEMTRVVIQACTIMQEQASTNDAEPDELLTNCDITYGNSGALILQPSFADDKLVGLAPIAINQGEIEDLGAKATWDPNHNSGVAVRLDERAETFLSWEVVAPFG